ncbi:uncharacterized protein PRCAT00002981001 [Priceomyces carsonii]|uniref:uncharacterized protein n=1 Tax=Priceomyces carsonii TaxID=28549 RepID=UPI002ED85DF6|nr:unnamed protein product [Priceomyces carsonii]
MRLNKISISCFLFVIAGFYWFHGHTNDKVDHLTFRAVRKLYDSSKIIDGWIDISFFPCHQSVTKSEGCKIHSGELGAKEANIRQILFENFESEHDPRLLPALWISAITNEIKQKNGTLDPSFTLPFSWSSWLSITNSRKKVHPPLSSYELNCDSFIDYFQSNATAVDKSCVNLNNDYKRYPCLAFTKAIDYAMPEEARRIVGSTFLSEFAPIPKRVLFLGIGPQESLILVPTSSNKSEMGSLIDIYMKNTDGTDSSIKQFKDVISISNEIKILTKMWNSFKLNLSSLAETDVNSDIFRIAKYNGEMNLLSKKDFLFDLKEYMAMLEGTIALSYSEDVKNDFDKSLLETVNLELRSHPDYSKYFHEALVVESGDGEHFDWRFFRSIKYSDYERRAILHRLTRAWLQFTNSIGIVSFLAHGSLLGWYWNGMSLPWDQDVDVQITTKSLLLLARNYNQTVVCDFQKGFSYGVGSYLIDVGSSFFSRSKDNGANLVDARFIDIESGFYVDITALSFTKASETILLESSDSVELNQLLDSDFLIKKDSCTESNEKLYEDCFTKRELLQRNQSLFNCRNHHFYILEELTPLIPTLFEGVRAYIPNKYESILKREYRRGTLLKSYGGYTYRPILGTWVSDNTCRHDLIGTNCSDEETILEAKCIEPLILEHKQFMRTRQRAYEDASPEIDPVRTDPWMVRRGQKIVQIFHDQLNYDSIQI